MTQHGAPDPVSRPAHLPVSLVVVSRHRPRALLRCLTAIGQLDHPEFELIVVADPGAAGAVRALGLRLKLAVFDVPNVSAARNVGLRLASAGIVAFVDDDAVPEPTWLSRLTAPFADLRVCQAGGFVLGRSGLAWQWRARYVRGDASDEAFDAPPGPSLHAGSASRTVKTEGTCCAFRRDDLLAIGGFDEGFRFYLDEADVNLRLAGRGGLTAMVPDAVVHHGFHASARRGANRLPLDLTEIGASLARFVARHAPDDGAALARRVEDQRRRLLRLVLACRMTPWRALGLMRSLRRGLAEPIDIVAPGPSKATPLPFLRLPGTGPREGVVIAGATWDRVRLEEAARAAVAEGRIVTLFCLSRGIRPQRLRFCADGYWLQTGGRFGRTVRHGPRVVLVPPRRRLAEETARLGRFRPVSALSDSGRDGWANSCRAAGYQEPDVRGSVV